MIFMKFNPKFMQIRIWQVSYTWLGYTHITNTKYEPKTDYCAECFDMVIELFDTLTHEIDQYSVLIDVFKSISANRRVYRPLDVDK